MTGAVVFDMDGLLISSEEIWDRVREDLTAEAGGRWGPEAHTDMMGMSTPEWTGYMHDRLGVVLSPSAIEAEVERRLIDRYRAEPPFIDGAIDAVRGVAALGMPMAVASSSTRRLIEAVLEQAGIAGLFAVTVSSEEVERGKPAPDVYLEALRRLGVDPADATAVEDSGAGIRSAHAAGVRVIAVPNAIYPPGDDALALADVVLPTIHGLPEAIAG
ncbi:MAG: HAD family hydrolase [Thermoleophilia bacterium]